MKKLFLMLCAVTLASCSNDDDGGSSSKLLPETITLSGDSNSSFDKVVHITYDDKRRINTMMVGDDSNLAFHYANDNEIAQIDFLDGGTTETVAITYDSKGRIASFQSDGTTTPVTYFENGSFSISGTVFDYNNDGDIASYDDYIFTYESGKKGAFANVRAYEPVIMALIDNAFLFYGTHRPLLSVAPAGEQAEYTLQHTYNDNGYVTTTTMTGPENATITYQYE
jgi:hypothetical protein